MGWGGDEKSRVEWGREEERIIIMMYGCIHLIIWVHCACYKQLYFTVARTALCNVLNTGTDGDAVDIKYTVLRVNTNLQSIRIHNLPEYRNKGTPVRVSARSGCIPQ